MDETIAQNIKTDLREARKYLPNADEATQLRFAERQFRARCRFADLKSFYSRNYCRMTRLHLLASCAVTLGRFAGYSETFDQMGEHFMPLNRENQPRTVEWRAFIGACEENLPVEVREELWLAAHFKDLQNVRESGLYARFESESARHKNEPVWQFLKQHMDVSLGVRLMDNSAISGILPYETAIADSLVLSVKKLATAASRLVFLYTKESARAILDFSERTPKNLFSYRRTAFDMTRYFFLSFTVSKIFRHGVRTRERGKVAAQDENWSLLEMAMGAEKVEKINPLIREFYANPSRFHVTTTLKLETVPARFWSRFLTFIFGQGLYETDLQEIPTRFRIFERKDGSMHFVRELFCNGKYRIFDSDFVVRNGKLYEVFTDMKASVEMQVEPIENGGLLIQSRKFLFHGRAMPSIGLNVEFKSRVEDETLKIDGQLLMKPKTKAGEFFAHKILRRPKNLGSIHYTARRKAV
ncbi:MAG: DUF4166 domain-containing protein [Acidobacteriota bacterium]|nr:DUF4166 domain-containing protein [Acidobacteriota bacterium]